MDFPIYNIGPAASWIKLLDQKTAPKTTFEAANVCRAPLSTLSQYFGGFVKPTLVST